MRKFVPLLLLLLPLTVLAAAPKTFSVRPQAITQTLYFNGTVDPIDSVPVISPTQGVVEKKMFSYGQIIKKGQPLLTVDTGKALESLRTAEVAFFKAQANYQKVQHWQGSSNVINAQNTLIRNRRSLEQAQTSYQENQHLYKLGIISKDALTQSEDAYDNAQMSYQQAQMALQDALSQGQGDNLLAAKLEYENAQDKYSSLRSQVKSSTVRSPATGIALVPKNTNNSDNNKSENTQVAVGSTIQYQQVLLNIGNLQGIRVSFSVPEINIDQLHPGLSAMVTSSAFPGVTLHGYLTEVAAQAGTQGASGGNAPTFQAQVSVPEISAAQRKLIRSGMDAQVAINVFKQDSSLVVPVNAVTQNAHGQSVVTLYNPTTGQQTQKVVITGKVTPHFVQIQSGLSAGEQVVVPSS